MKRLLISLIVLLTIALPALGQYGNPPSPDSPVYPGSIDTTTSWPYINETVSAHYSQVQYNRNTTVAIEGELGTNPSGAFSTVSARIAGVRPAQVVVVGPEAQYTTIQGAIDAITDAGSSKPYVIKIAPGLYDEEVTLKSYISLHAFEKCTNYAFPAHWWNTSWVGPTSYVLIQDGLILPSSYKGEIVSIGIGNEDADNEATVYVEENSHVAFMDCTIVGGSGGSNSSAILVEDSADAGTLSIRLYRCYLNGGQNGASGLHALYSPDSNRLTRVMAEDSYFRGGQGSGTDATGGDGVNIAYGSVFAKNSIFEGGDGAITDSGGYGGCGVCFPSGFHDSLRSTFEDCTFTAGAGYLGTSTPTTPKGAGLWLETNQDWGDDTNVFYFRGCNFFARHSRQTSVDTVSTGAYLYTGGTYGDLPSWFQGCRFFGYPSSVVSPTVSSGVILNTISGGSGMVPCFQHCIFSLLFSTCTTPRSMAFIGTCQYSMSHCGLRDTRDSGGTNLLGTDAAAFNLIDSDMHCGL